MHHHVDKLVNSFVFDRADGYNRDAQLLGHFAIIDSAAVVAHLSIMFSASTIGTRISIKLQRQVQVALRCSWPSTMLMMPSGLLLRINLL
jgi:hypothetical protein